MLNRGEISKKKFDEWAHATKNIKKLPEKVKKNKKKKSKQKKGEN